MNPIAETAQYSFSQADNTEALLFTWKPTNGLGAQDFRAGIAAFADLCKTRRPTRAVIDARALDQASPAVAWLRGHDDGTEAETYNAWWLREIVPAYHAAGIASMAVATGDPNAPGEIPSPAPEVHFKIGYFPDLDTASAWRATVDA